MILLTRDPLGGLKNLTSSLWFGPKRCFDSMFFSSLVERIIGSLLDILRELGEMASVAKWYFYLSHEWSHCATASNLDSVDCHLREQAVI